MQVVPFVLIGIGVDDIFIIIAAYDTETDPSQHIVDRTREALVKSGPTIFMTTLTDALAFGLCAISYVPAISSFGIYAAIGVVLDFMILLTVFIACMTLDNRRLAAKRCCCCLCCTNDPDGLENPKCHVTYPVDIPQPSVGLGVPAPPCEPKASEPSLEELNCTQRVFRWWGGCLSKPVVRFSILIISVTLGGLGVWRATEMSVGLDAKKLIFDDSDQVKLVIYLIKQN